MTQKERWEQWTPPETLIENTKLFFEIMDKREHSDNTGEAFQPNKFNKEERIINSCRVWDTHRLGKILKKMKELALNKPTNP